MTLLDVEAAVKMLAMAADGRRYLSVRAIAWRIAYNLERAERIVKYAMRVKYAYTNDEGFVRFSHWLTT